MNPDDVDVAEPGDRPGLVQEPLDLVVGGVLGPGDRLDGDDPTELHVEGLVDDPHPPSADLLQRLMARE